MNREVTQKGVRVVVKCSRNIRGFKVEWDLAWKVQNVCMTAVKIRREGVTDWILYLHFKAGARRRQWRLVERKLNRVRLAFIMLFSFSSFYAFSPKNLCFFLVFHPSIYGSSNGGGSSSRMVGTKESPEMWICRKKTQMKNLLCARNFLRYFSKSLQPVLILDEFLRNLYYIQAFSYFFVCLQNAAAI